MYPITIATIAIVITTAFAIAVAMAIAMAIAKAITVPLLLILLLLLPLLLLLLLLWLLTKAMAIAITTDIAIASTDTYYCYCYLLYAVRILRRHCFAPSTRTEKVMDPVELLRALRDPRIVWNHDAYVKPHSTHYNKITTKQLSMVVRPYPSGWTMPTEKEKQWLWLPSASLLQQVADIAAKDRINSPTVPSNLPTAPQHVVTEKRSPEPTDNGRVDTMLTPMPPVTPTGFIEYTPSFKPLKRRISRIPTRETKNNF